MSKEYIEKKAALDAFCPMCIYKPVCLATPIDYPCRALTALNTQITADVKPVVRGGWVKKKHMMYCSECCAGFDPINCNDFLFCPNCGADMRGEQQCRTEVLGDG